MRQIKKFAVANTLASILLLSTFALLAFNLFHEAESRENNVNLERCIRTFKELLNHKGIGFSIVDGKLLAGSYIINGNFEVPDKVQEIFGGTATVFMGDTRVSTNVLLDDGKRAIGTRLVGPAYDAIFKQGKAFRGETMILGIPYFTFYDPIKDGSGKIIGALYVGLKKSDLLAHHILLKTQMLLILLGLSIVFIAFTIILNKSLKNAERTKEADHRFLQTLIDTIPTPVFYKDANGKYLGCNKAYESFIGLPKEQLTGKTVFDIALPHLAETYDNADSDLFLSQGVQVYESAVKYADGAQHDVIFYKATFPAADGSLGGLIGTILDISERKRAEMELRESRQHLLDIIQFYPDATMVIDIHGQVSAWNRAMEELSGVRAEEMLGRGDYEYAIPFYGERRPILIDLALQPDDDVEGKYAHVERRGNTLFGEAYIHNARGEELYFHGTASALRNTSGEIIGAIESIRDVTERKRAEEEVVFKNIILSTQQDVSPNGILVLDESGVIISYNRRFVEMWGFPHELAETRDDVLLLQFAATNQSDPEGFLARVKYLHEHRDEKSREEIDLKDGRVFDRYSAPMTGIDGKYHGRVWYFRDITEQKTAENLLVEREAFLSNIIDSIQDGISIIDTDLCIVRQNLTLEKYFSDKYPMVGRKCFEVYHGRTEPCEFCPSLITLQTGDPSSKIFSTVENDSEIWIEIFTFPLFDSEKSRITGVIAYRRDISRRKRAEEEIRVLNEELVCKEKLAILGQLSGSVSHELRNPLGVISNAVYFLKMVNADADETTREYLDIINHEINLSQRIITDLLDFARTKTPQKRSVMVCELIEESLKRCSRPENVEIKSDIPDSLPPLNVDPLQMGQVYQNIITNGIQAMPNGGAMRIAARFVQGSRFGVQGSEKDIEPGTLNVEPDRDFIEISIVDSGEGISPENMKKLFQPLFTTKAKGIGLGLTVCLNLTEANGGRIAVDSELGKGTTFTMILPVGG